MRKSTVAFVCIVLTLSLFLTACGTSAPSTAPSSPLPASSESAPPQVSSVVVEPEPEPEPEPEVDPTEATIALLQSGVWGVDINTDEGSELWEVCRFEGDTCYWTWCGYYAMGGVTRHCSYTIADDTVTISWEASTGGGSTYEAGSETFQISSDGTTLSSNDSLLEHRVFPAEGVDYFGDSSSDWKTGIAEMGLRIRTAPNTDAEIVSETRNGMSVTSIIGVSQADPAWYFVLYGSQIGYAHSDYIAVQ